MRFRILGPLEVMDASGWRPLPSAKQRSLLAALLINRNTVLSRDRLIEELWGDRPPAAAGNLLQQYVLRLRRALGTANLPLVTRPGGYLLELADAGEVDSGRFGELSARGRHALRQGEPARAAGVLAEALAHWRGPALADVAPSAGVDAARVYLEEQRLVALESRVEADLAGGAEEALVGEMRTLVRAHPWRERLWCQLMLALYRSGRRADALATYREVRSLLHAELAVEPGGDLARLHRMILAADSGLDRSGQGRELVRVAAGTGSAGEWRPAELPPGPAAFTGRADEVHRLCRLLAAGPRGPAAVVAISGQGGVGKSALALQVAHRVATSYPDGQLYLDLRGAAAKLVPLDPAEALARLQRSLGAGDSAIPADVDESAARFRSLIGAKRLLIVLDNARDAAQVRPLLPASPTCGVLITSRRILTELDGIVRLPLEVLPADQAITLLGRLAGTGRVGAEPPAAAEVVRWCGGLPLAVCVAAARLNARSLWSVRQLADRLADAHQRLAELHHADRDVRASLAVSYQDLPAGHRRVLRLMSLMDTTDIGVAAAAAVTGTSRERTEAIIDDLVDAQLVECRRSGRYRMHDLTRLYARERAAAEDPPAAWTRAVRDGMHHYLATARYGSRLLRPTAGWRTELPPATPAEPDQGLVDRASACRWFDLEAPNLPGLVRQAATAPLADPELAVAIVAAVHPPLSGHGRWNDLLAIGRAAAGTIDIAGNPLSGAVVRGVLGDALSNSGLLTEAISHARAALSAYRRIGHVPGKLGQLNRLGSSYARAQRYDQAAACFQEVRELYRRQGNRAAEGVAVSNLGVTYQRVGRLDESLATHHEAVSLCRECGDPGAEAIALGNLAEAHRRQGRPDAAVGHFRESLAADRRAGTTGTYGEAERWWGLGMAHRDLGDLLPARQCWQTAAGILCELGLITVVTRRRIADSETPETPEVIRRNI